MLITGKRSPGVFNIKQYSKIKVSLLYKLFIIKLLKMQLEKILFYLRRSKWEEHYNNLFNNI